MTAVWLAGWALAALLAARLVVLGRRLELVAEAEHELRGPLAAIELGLAADAGPSFQLELDRVRAALADLAAARSGRAARGAGEQVELATLARAAAAGNGGVSVDWRAGAARVSAPRGRLAQVLCNLVANAVEHGGGRVVLSGRRRGGSVRIEVADSGRGFARAARPDRAAGRGRGLAVVRRAVREAGGTVSVASGDDGSTVAVELPVSRV